MDPPDRFGYDLYAGSQILFGNENWHFLRIGMELFSVCSGGQSAGDRPVLCLDCLAGGLTC